LYGLTNFPGTTHSLDSVRDALSLPDDVPLVDCDARDRESAKQVLITLVDHLYAMTTAEAVS
jgi:uncharacterized protein